MTRKELEREAVGFSSWAEWEDNRLTAIDFAIEQINAALEEAAELIDGVGTLEHNDAEKIRALKIA